MELAELKKTIANLQHWDFVQNDSITEKALAELAADIHRSIYTVVVLGEFKRGKSTFVNALLGMPLLPMNNLPETATINAIMYNEEPRLSVVYMDGTQREGEVSYDFLQQFSARKADEQKLQAIKYIKIGYPLDMLKNRVVLVDTPGVSDLNQQRTEVTYGFLPKANTVIFVLDANSPLKKSEKEFIEQQLFPLGIKDIIFLANKYDCIDEEEEDESFLDDLRVRLEKAFHIGEPEVVLQKIEVYPLSARDALDGLMNGDAEMLAESGLPKIQERIKDMLLSSDLEKKKLYSYQERLQNIVNRLVRSLTSMKSLKQTDADTLRQAYQKLQEVSKEREKQKKNIRAYAEQSKAQMYAMADKSIQYFQHNLLEEITAAIMSYRGEDFKDYIEQNITRSIKQNFESWTRAYSPYIDELLHKLEQELAYGLSWYFKQKIYLETNQTENLKPVQAILDVEADDVSVVNTQVGVAAAVGAVGLFAVLGSAVMPLIGLAAIPYFRRKMLRQRLEAAKADVIPEVQAQIAEAILRLKQSVHQYIDQKSENIIENTEAAYQMILQQLQENIDKELNARKTSAENLQQEISHIDQAMQELQSLSKKITD